MTLSSPSSSLALILSSPSGGGKTSLAKRLIHHSPTFFLSVSATTRPPRPCEIPGKDYIFLNSPTFQLHIQQKRFIEWAKVFEAFYGTPAEPVYQAAAKGYDIIFDVDWQGRQRLSESLKLPCVSVFILPPSLELLRQRLSQRDTDPRVIAYRMSQAQQHIAQAQAYDYVIVNDDLATCTTALQDIMRVERWRHHGKTSLKPLLDTLLKLP